MDEMQNEVSVIFDRSDALHAIRDILTFLGEDPQRGGLKETPGRFLRALEFHMSGTKQDPGYLLKTFEDGAEKCDQMVLLKGIPIWSTCEHHLAPFFGVAHIAYIPAGKVVGLSKLSRLADIYARRLQIQERLTAQIAEALVKHLSPRGVGVVLECRHTCMECRGIQKANIVTKTSALHGALRDDAAARAEFFSMVQSS